MTNLEKITFDELKDKLYKFVGICDYNLVYQNEESTLTLRAIDRQIYHIVRRDNKYLKSESEQKRG